MSKKNLSFLLNEEIFQRILNHKTLGKKIAARIINEILGFEYDKVLKNLKRMERNPVISSFSIDYIMHNLVEKNSLLIDIRLSYTSNEFISFLYELNMDLLNYSRGKKKVIQIFIDSKDRFHKNQMLYNVCCMEKSNYVNGNRFFEKYYVNLEYVRKTSYKTIIYEKDKIIRFFYFFVFYNKKILEELYFGDEVMLKVLREIRKISLYEDIPIYYVDDFSNIKYLYEEYFINDAVNLGMIEERKQMIKRMYDNGASLDLIRRSSNVTLDEIKKVIENEKNKL